MACLIMTNKYTLMQIRKSRNEFEALLRIYGVSNLKLCKIMEINPATSRKYIEDPTLMRFIHMHRLSQSIGLQVKDIVDTIVYDLN